MRYLLILLGSVTVLSAQVRELWRANLEDSNLPSLTNHVLGDAVVDNNSELIVAGTLETLAGRIAGFAAKFDAKGSLAWKVTEQLPPNSEFGCVDADAAGNSFVIFSLSADTLSRTGQAVLIKLSPEGRELWRVVRDGVVNAPNATAFKADREGDVFVASLLARDVSQTDFVTEWEVTKIGSDGRIRWRTTLPNYGYLVSSDTRASRMISLMEDGSLVLAGTYVGVPFPAQSINPGGFATRVGPNGDVKWWTTDYKGSAAPDGYVSVGLSRNGTVCASGPGAGPTIFSKSGNAILTGELGGMVVGSTADGGFLLRVQSFLCALHAGGARMQWGIQPLENVWEALPHRRDRWLAVGGQWYSPHQFQFASINRRGQVEWRAALPNSPFTKVVGPNDDTARPKVLNAPDGTVRVVGQAPFDNRISKPGIVALSFAVSR